MFGFGKKEEKRGRGKPKGFITSEETKRKISEGCKTAWEKRPRRSESEVCVRSEAEKLKRNKQHRERYATDPEYRERMKNHSRIGKAKELSTPEGRERRNLQQRVLRKRVGPEKFAIYQARSGLNRMNPTDVDELLGGMGYVRISKS